jgi:hypothetical protein
MATATQCALIRRLDAEKRSRAPRQFLGAQRRNTARQDEEASLVLAAKRGDGHAFEILIKRYQRKLLEVSL